MRKRKKRKYLSHAVSIAKGSIFVQQDHHHHQFSLVPGWTNPFLWNLNYNNTLAKMVGMQNILLL